MVYKLSSISPAPRVSKISRTGGVTSIVDTSLSTRISRVDFKAGSRNLVQPEVTRKLVDLQVAAVISSGLRRTDSSFADDAVALLHSLEFKSTNEIVETALDTSHLSRAPLKKQNPAAGARALRSTSQETQAAQELLETAARRNRTAELDDMLRKNREELQFLPTASALDVNSTKLNDLDDTFRALTRTRGDQLEATMRRANGQLEKATTARKAVTEKINRFKNNVVSVDTIDATAVGAMQGSLDRIRQRVADMRLRLSDSDMFRVADTTASLSARLDGPIDAKKLQFWDDFDVLPSAYRGATVDPPPTMRKIIDAAGESKSSTSDLLEGIEVRLKKIDDFRANRPPGISAAPQLRKAQKDILTDASFLDNLPADSELRDLARKTPDEVSALGDDYWNDVTRLLGENTDSMTSSQLELLEVTSLQVRLVSIAPKTKPTSGFTTWSDVLVGDDALVPFSVGGQTLSGHIDQLARDMNRFGTDLDALDTMLRSKYANPEKTRASLLRGNDLTPKTANEIDDDVNAIFADIEEWTNTFPGDPGDPAFASWKETVEGATDVGKKRKAIEAFGERAEQITSPANRNVANKNVELIKQKLRNTGQAHPRFKKELSEIADMLDTGDIDGALQKFNKSLVDMEKPPSGTLTRAEVAKANRNKAARQNKKTRIRGAAKKRKRDPMRAAGDQKKLTALLERKRRLDQILDASEDIDVVSVRQQAVRQAPVTKMKARVEHTVDWGQRLTIGIRVGGGVVFVGGIATMIASGAGGSLQGAVAVNSAT